MCEQHPVPPAARPVPPVLTAWASGAKHHRKPPTTCPGAVADGYISTATGSDLSLGRASLSLRLLCSALRTSRHVTSRQGWPRLPCLVSPPAAILDRNGPAAFPPLRLRTCVARAVSLAPVVHSPSSPHHTRASIIARILRLLGSLHQFLLLVARLPGSQPAEQRALTPPPSIPQATTRSAVPASLYGSS